MMWKVRRGHLVELSPELWAEGSDEEDEAQFVELDTGGRGAADAGGEALDEAAHESDGNNNQNSAVWGKEAKVTRSQ